MRKNFINSKKGNYSIFAIILIPIILTIIAMTVCNQRNKTVYKSEIKTSISTFLEYENKYNGTVSISKDKNGENILKCLYTTSQKEQIKNDFRDFFPKIDGYNSLWSYETIEFKEEEESFSLCIKCTIYIPKLTTLKVIDYWGIEDGSYKTTNGWYQTHTKTMNQIKPKSGESPSSKYWQKIEIEVNSSCV